MLDEVKNEPFINHVDEWFVFFLRVNGGVSSGSAHVSHLFVFRLDSTRYVLASFYFASSYKKGESALLSV
ncbi:hypothetical protein CN635_16275 [Priestia aryabhattai]|nr:hypothetical protein CN635_16275 [Priestia aryabhattai]